MQRGDDKPRTHYTQKDKDHFIKDVDPYVKPGDPTSGLLPFVYAEDPVKGAGDHRIQAYNYRLCVTTDPAKRLPFAKPAGYRELDHEMLLRNFEAGDLRFPSLLHKLPNGKTDWNSMHAVGTDYVGANWEYPAAKSKRRMNSTSAATSGRWPTTRAYPSLSVGRPPPTDSATMSSRRAAASRR
ncbi:FAD-dependent oxidoreductase [bacterium]|nr:FAD-dependent oxidoreductase [bacterium]